MHEAEAAAIDGAIHLEFQRGLDGLPGEFAGNFRGTEADILKSTNIIWKQQWLSSIWYARDYLRQKQGLVVEERDPLAQAFITRFNLRRKRKLRMVTHSK